MSLLLAISVVSLAGAKAEERMHGSMNPSNSIAEPAPGIRTDRLSPRQLRSWAAIERIVFAKDSSGRFIHPKLHSLWQRVETGGSVVQVELTVPKAPGDHQAGRFQVEKSDPDGARHVAVIRLCLPVIDRALVRKGAAGAEGFVRFEGLRREERYAEILGHEMAHAVWILGDREHARLIEQLDREIGDFDSRSGRGAHGTAWDEPTVQRLKRIESLIAVTERPAEIAEEEVWRELRQNRPLKPEIAVQPAVGRVPGQGLSGPPASGTPGSETATELIAFILSSN